MFSFYFFLASVQIMTYAEEYQDKGKTLFQGRYIRKASGILKLLASIRKRKIRMKKRMNKNMKSRMRKKKEKKR